MSTDKFHISDATPGHDTHSAVLNRLGYGDLLTRKGRTEFTIDTTKLNKSAADHGAILGAGTGAAIGAVAGAELAGDKASATTKLLSTLAGTGIGGVGGYFIGSALDTPESDGLSIADKNTGLLNTIGVGAIGGALGYGTSKYLIGAKNKTHHLLSALAGAGLGAGVGSMITDSQITSETRKQAITMAEAAGLTGKQKEDYINAYVRQMDLIRRDRKGRGPFGTIADIVYDYDDPEVVAAAAAAGGLPDHTQNLQVGWGTAGLIGGGAAAAGYFSGPPRSKLHAFIKTPTGQFQIATQRLADAFADYKLNGGATSKIDDALAKLNAILKKHPDLNLSNRLTVDIPENVFTFDGKNVKRLGVIDMFDNITSDLRPQTVNGKTTRVLSSGGSQLLADTMQRFTLMRNAAKQRNWVMRILRALGRAVY